MTFTINLTTEKINNLDITPVTEAIAPLLEAGKIAQEEQLQFAIAYEREEQDPRELSEIPEVRLWFIRLDSIYPWLPFLLDWRAGELARYAAMLVPHQFSRAEGIIYNPEALEIFVTSKIFVIADWCKQQKIEGNFRLKSLAKTLGYDLDDNFFSLI